MRLQTEFHPWIGLFQAMFPSPQRTFCLLFLSQKYCKTLVYRKCVAQCLVYCRCSRKVNSYWYRLGLMDHSKACFLTFFKTVWFHLVIFHKAFSPWILPGMGSLFSDSTSLTQSSCIGTCSGMLSRHSRKGCRRCRTSVPLFPTPPEK